MALKIASLLNTTVEQFPFLNVSGKGKIKIWETASS